MAIDYRQVLTELRAEEERLISELEAVRAMIPGAEVMARRLPSPASSDTPPIRMTRLPYFGMGTKEAILHLLSGSAVPLMPSDITKTLLDGGVQTRANDFAATVGSTLTQMKIEGLVERKEDGWIVSSLGRGSVDTSARSWGNNQFDALNALASLGSGKLL